MAILSIAAAKIPLTENSRVAAEDGLYAGSLTLNNTMQSEVQEQLLPSQGPSQASELGGRGAEYPF